MGEAPLDRAPRPAEALAAPIAGTYRQFRWSGARRRAAVLVAEDSLTDVEIAARVGIHERQLRNWKADPAFRERVGEHVAALEAVALRYEIAKRARRVAALDDRWHRMARVIEARGREMDGEAPGAETGLLVRQVKVIGTGEQQRTVEEYAVDTGLLRELRATEEQAARELGQWAERQEHAGPGGGPLRFTLVVAGAGAGEAGPADDGG
jgi:hypothetical protein